MTKTSLKTYNKKLDKLFQRIYQDEMEGNTKREFMNRLDDYIHTYPKKKQIYIKKLAKLYWEEINRLWGKY